MNKMLLIQGQTLKSLRDKCKLTQAEVAVAVGVSLTAYQNWEKGLSLPNPSHQAKLKSFFNKGVK